MQLSSETVRSNTVRRPHLRVVPLVKLDKRTRIGRRVGELVADFTEALRATTAISPVLAQKIADAATLKMIAETARAHYLEGPSASRRVTLGHLIRVERRAEAAIRALALPDQAKQQQPRPSIREHLLAREAAEAEARKVASG